MIAGSQRDIRASFLDASSHPRDARSGVYEFVVASKEKRSILNGKQTEPRGDC
jgi:hypothetical protein